jgi:hypothetical protein
MGSGGKPPAYPEGHYGTADERRGTVIYNYSKKMKKIA